MRILNGRPVAQEIKKKLKPKAKAFLARTGKKPGLAVILVGKDPASEIYVQKKIQSAKEVGFHSQVFTLSEKEGFPALKQKIKACNQDPAIHAFLVQLPLPAGWPVHEALSLIDPAKDADGLTPLNQGRTGSGEAPVLPCTPAGIMRLFQYYDIAVEGKNVVVVGRSRIVGFPTAQLLLRANATVTICHSRTKDLSLHTKRADIVVVSAGVPELLRREDFKKGAVVVDVGLHRIKKEGKTCLKGDVRQEGLEGHVAWATPVPGGVGPVTVGLLLENTLTLSLQTKKYTDFV